MIIDWIPDAKNVGLLFCSAEANSKYQVEQVEKYLTEAGLTCTRYPFADSNDMAAVVEEAAANSDVIYVPTDNACANGAGIIDGICRPAGVPVITGESGPCAVCGIATLSINYYDLGYATGKMAVKILKGEANISEMPIEYTPEEKLASLYNSEICQELGITPLEGYQPIQ
jgi:putative ABC transport system substrate-binding protein